MNNLADRILDLLRGSASDSLFSEFQADLELRNSPILKHHHSAGRVIWYCLSNLGVSIYTSGEQFISGHFHIAPITFPTGEKTSPFANPLPFGIPQGSRRADVHRSFGLPRQVHNPCGSAKGEFKSESYVIDVWHVVFWYALPGEELDELRVRYRPKEK